jgi:hypothetical protein
MARLTGSTWTEFAPSSANSCYGLVTSPGGDLYAAYSSSGLRVAKYAGSWTTIDGTGVVNAISGGASLALDASGTPSVAYGESSGGNVTVRKFAEPANWNPIGATGFTPNAVSAVALAMGPDDTPYVAYKASSSSLVSVQEFNGTEWSLYGTADFSPKIFGGPSLAVRSDGIPLVAFTTLRDYSDPGPVTVMVYR